MTGYVLIHGAWHGSWCWASVRRLLAAGAHRVFTPTLTGVGERRARISQDPWREHGERIIGCQGLGSARDLREEIAGAVSALRNSIACNGR